MPTVEDFLELLTQDDVSVTIYDMGLEAEECFPSKDEAIEMFGDYEVWSFDVDFYSKTLTLNIDSTEE